MSTAYSLIANFSFSVIGLAGKGEGWEKLKRDIRAELDEDALEAFHGTVSLPFAAGNIARWR